MKKFLKSKIGTVLLAVGFVAVLFMAAKTFSQKYRIDKQIKQLQTRADQIRSENEKLSDLVAYLNTEQYQEKAAREQLNLKKDGEYVVVLPNQNEQVSSASTEAQTVGNPRKWYIYFFKH